MKRRRLYRLPVVRGVVALVRVAEDRDEGARHLRQRPARRARRGDLGQDLGRHDRRSRSLFAIGLFFVLPVTVASFWKDELGNSVLFVVVEKLIRIAIFLGYLWAISHIKDLRRVFEYHGAEHKVISCYEADDELVPENAQKLTRACTCAAAPASC